LFEIATDGPGFMIDENIHSLGESLKLPLMYESRRDEIESRLVPIHHKATTITA
jgi:glyoxalase family protein